MTTDSKNRPVDEMRALGGLKATIWGNATENGGIRYSVEFARTYKGSDDKFHDTRSFDAREALQVARLAEKAYERIGELVAANRQSQSGEQQ
jgi:hypothetical protein